MLPLYVKSISVLDAPFDVLNAFSVKCCDILFTYHMIVLLCPKIKQIKAKCSQKEPKLTAREEIVLSDG